MPDIDKLQTFLQWAGGVAIIIGGVIAGIWKIVRGSSDESDRERDERERTERSLRYKVERELEIERFERKFEKIIESVRVSILGKIEAQQDSWQEDFKSITDRVSALNERVAGVEKEADGPHPRRPRQ